MGSSDRQVRPRYMGELMVNTVNLECYVKIEASVSWKEESSKGGELRKRKQERSTLYWNGDCEIYQGSRHTKERCECVFERVALIVTLDQDVWRVLLQSLDSCGD